MTASWGGWLDERLSVLGLSATGLSAAAGVPDSMVSRWRRQGVRPEVAQLRRLAAPLQVELLDLLVVSGHLTEQEAHRPAPVAAPGWAGTQEALAHDQALDPDLRELLLVQYAAMRTLTTSRRTQRRTNQLLTLSAESLAESVVQSSRRRALQQTPEATPPG